MYHATLAQKETRDWKHGVQRALLQPRAEALAGPLNSDSPHHVFQDMYTQHRKNCPQMMRSRRLFTTYCRSHNFATDNRSPAPKQYRSQWKRLWKWVGGETRKGNKADCPRRFGRKTAQTHGGKKIEKLRRDRRRVKKKNRGDAIGRNV